MALQLELLAAARARLPQDPFPHYLAHCRIGQRGSLTDVMFTSGERSRRTRAVREGLVIADFAESVHAESLFGSREGEGERASKLHGEPRPASIWKRSPPSSARTIPGVRWLYRQYIYWSHESLMLAFKGHGLLMRLVALQAKRHMSSAWASHIPLG